MHIASECPTRKKVVALVTKDEVEEEDVEDVVEYNQVQEDADESSLSLEFGLRMKSKTV